jgi:hypothetical protein
VGVLRIEGAVLGSLLEDGFGRGHGCSAWVLVMVGRGATRDTAAFRGPILGQSKRRPCSVRVLNDVRYGGVIGRNN